MALISSKLGLLLVVFTLTYGEPIKDAAGGKPATEKAKLRDWFFRLSLRNDLIKLKKVGQDYLPVVKLRTEDGEGEDFSILLDEEHSHPNNNCSSESASQDKQMRFVMRGLDQEFMCTEIKNNIPDVPEERSMSTDNDRRGPGRDFMEEKGQVEKGKAVNVTRSDVEVQLVSNIEDSDDEDVVNKDSTGSLDTEETRRVTDEEQSTTEKDCVSPTDKNLLELITDFNNIVETITSSSDLEIEPTITEKESANREQSEEPEVFAEVIGDKNERKIPDGLDPLIDHLNGVASHQQFQDPIYAKAIQDLVKDFRAHNISEATWDGEKLNTILDKIEELVTGDNPEEAPTDKTSVEVVEASKSKESVSEDVKQMQQELETIRQISSQPDISNVNQTLSHLMANLHNLVGTVNGPNNPEARMSDKGDGRVNRNNNNSASNTSGSDNDDRAKNMDLIDSLLSTNMEEVIEDLRKFVDVVDNKPYMRSADSNEEGRSNTIVETNGTSTEPGAASTTEKAVELDTETSPLSNVSLTTQETVNNDSTLSLTTVETVNIDDTVSLATEETVNIDDTVSLTTEETVNIDDTVSLATEENVNKDGTTHATEVTEAENIGVASETISDSDGSTTTEDTLAKDGTTVASGESAAQALNDATEDEDYDSDSLINLLSTWKKKFFIILGCFIVSMVLFLIIIAVLIYKVQQNKPNPDAAK